MSEQPLNNYNLNKYQKQKSADDFDNWIFEQTEANAPEINVDLAWDKVSAQLVQPKQKQRFLVPFLRVAAAVSVFAISVFAYTKYFSSPEMVTIVSETRNQEVLFPDGSVAILNESASVTYPEAFGSERNVEFTGEAYFDIQKSDKPFLIKTGDVDVRILGTAFNLSTAGDEVHILVERGIVAFEKGESQVKITKDQLGIFTKATNEVVIDNSPPSNIMSWRNGVFHFDDAELSDVTAQLSAYYQIEFRVAPQFEACKVTASFMDATLADVLTVLETILSAEVSQVDSVVRIKGQGCN